MTLSIVKDRYELKVKQVHDDFIYRLYEDNQLILDVFLHYQNVFLFKVERSPHNSSGYVAVNLLKDNVLEFEVSDFVIRLKGLEVLYVPPKSSVIQ